MRLPRRVVPNSLLSGAPKSQLDQPGSGHSQLPAARDSMPVMAKRAKVPLMKKPIADLHTHNMGMCHQDGCTAECLAGIGIDPLSQVDGTVGCQALGESSAQTHQLSPALSVWMCSLRHSLGCSCMQLPVNRCP